MDMNAESDSERILMGALHWLVDLIGGLPTLITWSVAAVLLVWLAPWLLRAAIWVGNQYRAWRLRWSRAQAAWRRFRRDTPAYRKVSKRRRVALSTRAEWNRNRDTLAILVFQRDGYHCAWCDVELDNENWSIDHIIPISKGGTNELFNLQPMCRSCNSMKGDRVDTWGKFWDRLAV
jgi:5-methylcytosine-specific restriction endonuclease McrA